MAFAPLKLTGNLAANGVDVSDQVTAFNYTGNRETVTIPATFGTRMSYAAGNDTYEVTIDYLQNVATPTALTLDFWEALADEDGTILLTGTFDTGAVSSTNPEWEGTAIVTSVGIGGEVNQIGTDSVTFPLTGRPTKSES